MNVLLLSTYDLGHQPFGLASPAAWLRDAGADVSLLDLAIDALDADAVRRAGLIAIHLPMHTATRLGLALAPRLRSLNPGAHLCFFGLYAPLNEGLLREIGAETILGGEFEHGLAALYARLAASGGEADADEGQREPVLSLAKQDFQVPDRRGLPELQRYAYLDLGLGQRRTAGYTEASRGCKHNCRHCPVVPVYQGRFRAIAPDVVLADIRAQAAAGAEHITFGDPDFFNGPGHALRIVEALHEELPDLTYDVTIKVEHLIKQRRHLGTLARTGCLFVTTAVESVDDRVLTLLKKDHTQADFVRAVHLTRDAGLTLSPTFLPFTPWTTAQGYVELLRAVADLKLVENVAPVQLSIRLLLPNGSPMMDLAELKPHAGAFDPDALSYPWRHPDADVDALQKNIAQIAEQGEAADETRGQIFHRMWRAAHAAAGLAAPALDSGQAPPVPRMSEPWFCCAEPTAGQLAAL